jgi:hypothetical protein
MTKSLDSKTKINIENHDDYEEGPHGENLKQSLLEHYNLDKSYYSLFFFFKISFFSTVIF